MYLSMAMESGGRIDFVFPKKAFAKYGIPTSSARRYIPELREAGFISYDSGWNIRKDNKYKFSFAWKTDKT